MKIRNVLVMIILVFVLSLTVGFSAFVSEMSISKLVADVRVEKDVRITGIELVEGDIFSQEINYTSDTAFGVVYFNSLESTATYKVTITNFGNVDVYFSGYVIEELSHGTFECLDNCGQQTIPGLGSSVEMTFVVGYAEMEDTYFKLGIELKDIYVVSFENIDLESETVPEGDIFQKYIGSAFSKRDIIVYTDGVLLDDSNYEVDFGQLTIYGVTGNTVVKIKPSLNTIMVSNAISDADVFGSTVTGDVNNTAYIRNGTENDEYPIYYYRGNVTNNHVSFGGFCWRIVRTTDRGGVKLVYNGKVGNKGKCDSTGSNSAISLDTFSSSSNSPADVGYMYGERYDYGYKNLLSQTDSYYYANKVTWRNSGYYSLSSYLLSSNWSNDRNTLATKYHYTCFNNNSTCEGIYYVTYFGEGNTAYYLYFSNGDTLEDVKSNMYKNTNSSKIKTVLDKWYLSNMNEYTPLLEDAVWCNDTNIISGSLAGEDVDAKSSVSFYNAYSNNSSSYNPTYGCSTDNGKFTVSQDYGNGALTYPVGLLTADEFTLAGSGYNNFNSASFLNIGQSQWTMSPYSTHHQTTSMYVVNSTGYLYFLNTGGQALTRPAIVLKNNLELAGGSGTASDPYRIKSVFTIDNVEYEYEVGMSWGDWINSTYNTIGVCYAASGGSVLLDGRTISQVNVTNKIRNTNYVLTHYTAEPS